VSITVAGQSGQFQLNVMLPLVADRILDSLNLLANALRLLGDKAIATFKVNQEHLNAALMRNPILVTALNPIIGYERAASIAKAAYQQGRPIVEVAAEQTDMSVPELQRLLDPVSLAHPHARADDQSQGS
jgi:fumarate hydratase class II